jgi:hypothetical protein
MELGQDQRLIRRRGPRAFSDAQDATQLTALDLIPRSIPTLWSGRQSLPGFELLILRLQLARCSWLQARGSDLCFLRTERIRLGHGTLRRGSGNAALALKRHA